MKIEKAKRPTTSADIKLSKYSDLWTAALETAVTGEAVRVSGLTFKEIRCIRANFRYRQDGFKFKGKMDKNDFICWLEPMPEEPLSVGAVDPVGGIVEG